MIIKEALFAGSSQRTDQKPKAVHPEFAFIGRSNVGKSSLINRLCGKKGLAHTSSTPGKTQLVNHFLINNAWYLVDLPGYGYAKMGHKGREKLQDIIGDYILNSEDLVLLLLNLIELLADLCDLGHGSGGVLAVSLRLADLLGEGVALGLQLLGP